MNALLSLVYVSSGVGMSSSTEIGRILALAHRRNQERAITGVLLYSEGNFMQYLEGPGDSVESTYQLIRNSRHHHNIIEIFRKEIDEREFADWPLAYWSPETENHLADRTETRVFNPAIDLYQASPSVSRLLLQGFWSRIECKKNLFPAPALALMAAPETGISHAAL